MFDIKSRRQTTVHARAESVLPLLAGSLFLFPTNLRPAVFNSVDDVVGQSSGCVYGIGLPFPEFQCLDSIQGSGRNSNLSSTHSKHPIPAVKSRNAINGLKREAEIHAIAIENYAIFRNFEPSDIVSIFEKASETAVKSRA